MDAIRVAYSDGKLMSTPSYIEAVKYRTTRLSETHFKIKRVLKISKLGYRVLYKNNLEHIPHIVTVKSNEEVYFPLSETPASQIIKTISEINNIHDSQITPSGLRAMSLITPNNTLNKNSAYLDTLYTINCDTFLSQHKLIKFEFELLNGIPMYNPVVEGLEHLIFTIDKIKIFSNSVYAAISTGYKKRFNYKIFNADNSMKSIAAYMIKTCIALWKESALYSEIKNINIMEKILSNDMPIVLIDGRQLKVFSQDNILIRTDTRKTLNYLCGKIGTALVKINSIRFDKYEAPWVEAELINFREQVYEKNSITLKKAKVPKNVMRATHDSSSDDEPNIRRCC
jgi:hypothetical protein